MGNSTCKPRNGSENLKGFLRRKFSSISGKRNIDELMQLELATGGHNPTVKTTAAVSTNLPEIIHVEPVIEDEFRDTAEPELMALVDSPVKQKKKRNIKERYHKQNKLKAANDVKRKKKPAAQNVQVVHVKPADGSSAQLPVTKHHTKCLKTDQPLQKHRPDGFKANAEISGDQKSRVFPETTSSNKPDVRREKPMSDVDDKAKHTSPVHGEAETKAEKIVHGADETVADKRNTLEQSRPVLTETTGNDKDETNYALKGSNRHRSPTFETIQPGCRVAAKLPKVTGQNDNTNTSAVALKLELQTKAKLCGGPDKGIIWPNSLDKLDRNRRAYFVEQFLKSQLFKQRVEKRAKGMTTWANGLTPFQKWIVEHDGTVELETALEPAWKRPNHAKAKTKCWRDQD